LKREDLAVPCAALDLRTEVEKGLEKVMSLRSEATVRRELAVMNARIAKVNSSVISGPATSVAMIDVEALVARWREARRDAERS
jgi:hypothetical protein